MNYYVYCAYPYELIEKMKLIASLNLNCNYFKL